MTACLAVVAYEFAVVQNQQTKQVQVPSEKQNFPSQKST